MNADRDDDKAEKVVQPGKGHPAVPDAGSPAEEGVLEFAAEPVSPPTGGPPPANSDPPAAWYTARRDGQRAGPFTLPALKQQFAAGTLSRDDLVWKVGMANWIKVGEMPDLATRAGSLGGAPPLPGGGSGPTPDRFAASRLDGGATQRPGGVFERCDELLRKFNGIVSNAAFYRISGLICLVLGLITFLMSLFLSIWQLHWFTGAVLFLAIGLGGQVAGQIFDLLHRIDSRLQEQAKPAKDSSDLR